MPILDTSKNTDSLRVKLSKLRRDHRELDERIANSIEKILDPLLIRRLKKEKLKIKDEIAKIQDKLTPDIIA